MGDIQNLSSNNAIEKIAELAKEQTCLFCTFTDAYALNTRPMSTQTVEDDGTIWFFSSKQSNKNREIGNNSKVQLLFGDPSKSEYLSIEGTAEIILDKGKIDELWTPIIKTWFQEGKDDPNLSLLKITPKDGYYWDTKHGKMVAFAKMLTSVVVGKTMDDGIEGKLNP
jgi:general stress protein 26